MRTQKVRLILISVTLAFFLVAYWLLRAPWVELVYVLIGLVAESLISIIIFIVSAQMGDKEKVSSKDTQYEYDRDTYYKRINIDGKQLGIWYESCANNYNAKYEVKDKNIFTYQLPLIIQSHFFKIIGAHLDSSIPNTTTIRLDGFESKDNGNTIVLNTTRSTFYNDLVTNRACDYKVENDVTIRDIYENKKFLTPFEHSVFSNHIGINSLVFYRGKMLIAHRGKHGSISKNKLTAGIAIAFKENYIRDGLKFYEKPILSDEIFLKMGNVNALAEMLGITEEKDYEELKLKMDSYLLGFGRNVYTAGKPQFYYAVVIHDDYPLQEKIIEKFKSEKDSKWNFDKKRILDESNILFVDNFKIAKDNDYHLLIKMGDKTKTYDTEKSFFANYWHLVSQEEIKGVPDWIYKLYNKDFKYSDNKNTEESKTE